MISLLLFFGLNVFAGDVPPAVLTVPSAHLEYWNDNWGIRRNNNCYNYSTNRVTNSFAQPGEASGIDPQDINCKEYYAAASGDLGLVPTKYFPFSGLNDDTLIALVIDPGYDFHWYRRGADGMWTHKPGATAATDVDNSDKKISNPETADRGGYTKFCGYFRVKNFPTEVHEQNAGFVRIGDMTELPGEQPSSVEVLKYSGRRNPRFLLSQVLLRNSELGAALSWIASGVHLSSLASDEVVARFSRLGGGGLLIVDTEGLYFTKGTSVQILDRDVLVQYPGSTSPLGLVLNRAVRF